MTNDIFGNLMNWYSVMDTLNELRERGELDEHQAGLIRILNYRENWQLREYVLNCVKDISAPSDELLQVIQGIMMDEDLYPEVRNMASEALANILSRQHNRGIPLENVSLETAGVF